MLKIIMAFRKRTRVGKSFFPIVLTLGIWIFVFPGMAVAAESGRVFSLKKILRDQVSLGLDEVQKARKQTPPEILSSIAPPRRFSRSEWQQLIAEQHRKITHLSTLIEQTPEEKLPEVLLTLYLDEKKQFDRLPPLEPYIELLGERVIAPGLEKYDQVGPRARERLLLLLGRVRSKEALPVVRKALDDANPRVGLVAQTALRLILNLEAKPELEKRLLTTKSSWALKHTLREISLLGDKDWYRDFFRLAKAHKISLYDLASFGDPADCPEEVSGENLDFLIKVIVFGQEPEFYPSDMISVEEFLLYLKGAAGRKSSLTKVVASQLAPRVLDFLTRTKDATELTGEHEAAILDAFNKTKDNLWLYPENEDQVPLRNPALRKSLKNLTGRGIFIPSQAGQWRVKDPLTADEQTSLKWFNVGLLSLEFPLVLSKSQYKEGEQAVARQMLVKLRQRRYLRQLYPVLTGIVQARFRRGGKIESFGTRVASAPAASGGFRDDEADELLQNIAENLPAEDIEEWLKKGFSDFLSENYFQEVLARKKGAGVDFQKKVFLFRITARDQDKNILASSVYPLTSGEEQQLILSSSNPDFPDHKIKVKVQLDRDTWFFHLDPLLIDLKPYAAGFDIYIPIAGFNETPLIHTLGGQKKTIIWEFQHLEPAEEAEEGERVSDVSL